MKFFAKAFLNCSLFLLGASLLTYAGSQRRIPGNYVNFEQTDDPEIVARTGENNLFCKTDNKCYIEDSSDTDSQVHSGAESLSSSLFTGILPVTKGGLGSATFSSGYIPYYNGSIFTNTVLFWDGSTRRLGLNVAAPTVTFEVSGDVALQSHQVTDDSNIDALNTSGKSVIRLTGSGVTVRGIDGGVDGKLIFLKNSTGGTLTLANNSGSASNEDKILTGVGGDVTNENGGTISLVYDGSTQRWSVITTKQTGTGVASTGSTYIGSATWGPNGGCDWPNVQNATFADVPTDASCNNPTVTGGVTDPGNKQPQVRFNATSGKTYKFEAYGVFHQVSTLGCSWRFHDGTNGSSPQTQYFGTAALRVPVIIGRLVAPATAATTVTIQSTATFGNGECDIDATTATVTGLEILVYQLD